MRPGLPRVRPRLVAALEERLPGTAAALDPGVATAALKEVVGPLVDVGNLTVGKAWLRDESCCDVRYVLHPRRGADARGLADGPVLLGRVHRDPAAAAAYVDRVVDMATAAGRPAPVAGSTLLHGGGVLSVAQFPFDPRLPGLPPATDPAVLKDLEPFAGFPGRPTVTLVHHPRDGACVLRFDARSPGGGGPGTWYGKVYPDGTGEVVEGFLRALPGSGLQHGATDGQEPPRFPRPVHYDPDLRLLVMEGLAGRPRVRELLRTVGPGLPPGAEDLLQAVRKSAGAVAALHGSDLATAPVHSGRDELTRLRQELAVVAAVWPREAERVAVAVDAVTGAAQEPDDLVLSHGDFTPSQVLLDGRTLGIVDLDTLCWADPALDLGRYLAYVQLLMAKAAGPGARAGAAAVGSAFLEAYAAVGTRARSAAQAAERIRLYVTTSLARSALHACRQLKPDRYELAMSLLEGTHTRRIQL